MGYRQFSDLKSCPSRWSSTLFNQDGRSLASLSRARGEFSGWLKRWSRWEFWPPYLFYPPVVAYIAYLGIRFRSWTLFTAANPAIPAGGFVGESKHQILEQLQNAAQWLPFPLCLACGVPSQRLAEAEEFMRRHGLQFPVVLKPDAGQRGSGVAIVRSPEQLREYLTQLVVPGDFAGVCPR